MAPSKDMDTHLDVNNLSVQTSNKRSNYLEWQEYFMAIAFLSAQRSKDPRTQVGACIVNKDKKIVGIGYNGMPRGCHDDKMPWNRAEDETKDKWLTSKAPYVCHAELNAVLNKNQACVSDCVIYVALFPCNMCAQIIIQSGISEVIYYSDKYHDKPEFIASRFLLETAGVKYRQFRPRQRQVVVDFELIEATAGQVPTLPQTHSFSPAREPRDSPDDLNDPPCGGVNRGHTQTYTVNSVNTSDKSENKSDKSQIDANTLVDSVPVPNMCNDKSMNGGSSDLSGTSHTSTDKDSDIKDEDGIHNQGSSSPKCVNRNNCFIQNVLPCGVNNDPSLEDLEELSDDSESEPPALVRLIHTHRRSSGLSQSVEVQFAIMSFCFIMNLILFTLYCANYYEPVCMATHGNSKF